MQFFHGTVHILVYGFCVENPIRRTTSSPSSLAAALVAGLPVVALVGPGALGGDLDPPAAAVAGRDGAGRAGAHHRRLLARRLHHGALLVALQQGGHSTVGKFWLKKLQKFTIRLHMLRKVMLTTG